MYKHNLYLIPDLPQRSMSTSCTVPPVTTAKKNNPPGHIISWQAEFVFCVCACGPEPLSLVKTNGKINTWLIQVPQGKMMARMFTYKLHPAENATFPAEGCHFAGICGNLLSSPCLQLGFLLLTGATV